MLSLNERLLEANKESEIFSANVAADSLEASLEKNREHIRSLAQTIHEYGPEELVLTGSGASYCTLYTAAWFMKTNSTLSVTHDFGPAFFNERNRNLEEKMKSGKVVAIVSSYSGKTADTLSVADYLGEHKVPRIALSRDGDGPLALKCEHVLAYGDKCLYTSAMGNVLALLGELLALRGEQHAADKLLNALKRLPDQMRSIFEKSDAFARSALETVKDEELFYVLGDGALWGLAYQYGYTNLTEYSRIDAACLRSCEWRHGPLEVLYRKPAMIHFISDDETREYGLATKNYCENGGTSVVVFDARDYFSTEPALAPFAVHIVSQLFLLYQATYRGINMDDYLEMHVKPYLPGETYY